MDKIFFLKGDKISLRPYCAEDARLVFDWFNDPVVTFYMFTGQKPKTSEQISVLMEKDVNSEENTIFIAVDNVSGDPIGIVGLYEIDHTARKAEMRIIIGNRKYWGKGYGTEMTDLIDFYGFDRLNLNRIYLGVTDENKGGVKAYEKAGYIYEGRLLQDIYRNSRYYDSVRMGLLRDDYYKKLYPEHKKKFNAH